jgi:hypothetical protein
MTMLKAISVWTWVGTPSSLYKVPSLTQEVCAQGVAHIRLITLAALLDRALLLLHPAKLVRAPQRLPQVWLPQAPCPGAAPPS